MKKTKRALSILLACVMLMGVMPIAAVSAEGTQDNPINANDKWFGYGVDCYLLNPSIAEGITDGVWYQLTAEKEGILYLEHKYKDVDYTIYITVDGIVYEGGSVNSIIYNGPIMTLPVQTGDIATIQIVTKDAAAGTVYANMNVISGDVDNPIKVKSAGIEICVGAGQTVYFQDDTLNADYATMGLLTNEADSNTVFYTVAKNSESGTVVKKAFTDSDEDGIIEATLGGSLGSAGAPPIKPAWAIENNADTAKFYTLTISDASHECVYEHSFATACTKCDEERTLFANQWLTLAGSSKSEEVHGIAFKYDIKVDGMEVVNGTTAVYDNATIEGFKLIGMGAVVTNDAANPHPTLEEADGGRVANVPAVYLCNLYDEAEDTVSFAIRLKNIPEEHEGTMIWFHGYIIVEIDGVETVIYNTGNSAAYNWF